MKLAEMERKIKEVYCDAKEIYLLQRNKCMNKQEHLLDFLVLMFTPLSGIVEQADLISDMGTYYLVIKEHKNLLVRAGKDKITEQDITDCNKDLTKKKFVVDGNRFKKVSKIYG